MENKDLLYAIWRDIFGSQRYGEAQRSALEAIEVYKKLTEAAKPEASVQPKCELSPK
jgi:hypothetical protein